ncbi:MAG: RNA polymerase-binding protein DksA [Acidiferrobacterales bacterium]|nr:RNA polymerase-binding protein DksA [Acidiferrobacterales bacterium]
MNVGITSNLETIAKSLNFEPYQAKSNEKYMNEKQRKHFLEILTTWKEELLGESSRTVVNLQDETINHPDQIDRASQETDMSIELRNRDRERRLIRKIEESIVRLETGGYGYCESCGIEIGLGRLEARPTAILCLDCKVLDEIKERRRH